MRYDLGSMIHKAIEKVQRDPTANVPFDTQVALTMIIALGKEVAGDMDVLTGANQRAHGSIDSLFDLVGELETRIKELEAK